jgi:hypothetical protein
LSFVPTGITATLQKPGSNSENISATVYGELTADGFSVEFSSTIPTTGYVLNYEVWSESGEVDTLNSLVVSYSDLVKAVKRFLGLTGTLAAGPAEVVDAIIQSGTRQFYFPPAVQGVEPAFEWSFMKPSTTLDVVSGTRVYQLPNAFGRLSGNMFFDTSDSLRHSIVLVSEHRINTLIQQSDETGAPAFASISAQQSMGQHGQLHSATFFPMPDKAYTLHFAYSAYTGKLSLSNQFPLGGPRFAELVLESCLAVAEQRENDERGLHTERFERLLVAAVAEDKRDGASHFGQMGSGEWSSVRVDRVHRNGEVTYKGQTW